MEHTLSFYSSKKVLITGGLGFIGSNLAHALVRLGAHVTIIDNLDPRFGGNEFNIQGIEQSIRSLSGSILDENLIRSCIGTADIVFQMAGQIAPIDSSEIPIEDFDLNVRANLLLLEACRHRPEIKIVFPSSRIVVGKVLENPICERHAVYPLNHYGQHKSFTEQYFALYHRKYGMRTTVLRLTNPYGARQQMRHSKYGIVAWFLRLAMEGKPITIFGDGGQLRDYLYIDDAVAAFLLAGMSEATDGNLYFCGYGRSVSLLAMAETVLRIVGTGSIEHKPWDSQYKKEETGDCEISTTKLTQDIGWMPVVDLEQGITEMFRYFKTNFSQYAPSFP